MLRKLPIAIFVIIHKNSIIARMFIFRSKYIMVYNYGHSLASVTYAEEGIIFDVTKRWRHNSAESNSKFVCLTDSKFPLVRWIKAPAMS